MQLQRGLGWIQGSLLFLIVFLQCTQRPGILQSVGEVLGIFIIGLFAIYALLGYRGELNSQKILFLILTWVLGVYLWGQALISGEGVSKAALINVIFVLIASCTVVLIRRDAWQSALKGIVYPAMFFGMSYLISTILVFVFGMGLSELAWFSFGLDQAGVEDRYNITICFPFSLSMHLGNITFFGYEWARAIGYMREPGIY